MKHNPIGGLLIQVIAESERTSSPLEGSRRTLAIRDNAWISRTSRLFMIVTSSLQMKAAVNPRRNDAKRGEADLDVTESDRTVDTRR